MERTQTLAHPVELDREATPFRLAPYLKGLWAIRLIVACISAFLPYDQPHIWRQVDTASVAIRYWNRWTHDADPLPFFLPGVLNAGDKLGIVRVEFPLLNFVLAPAYAAGPYWGRVLSQFMLVAMSVALILWILRIWQGVRVAGVNAGKAFYLLPLLSVPSIYLGRMLPDFFSVLFVLAAVGLSWDKNRPWASGVLFALGVLIKPPSILVAALFLCHPKWTARFRHWCLWGVPACLAMLAYYTAGLAWLGQFQDIVDVFGVHTRNPVEMLGQYFSHPRRIADVLGNTILFPGGGLLVALSVGLSRKKLILAHEGKLFGCLLVMILGIAALDGEHSFVHRYYYMSFGPLACLIAWRFFVQGQSKGMTLAAAALMVGALVDRAHMSLRSFNPEKLAEHAPPFSECAVLRARHPEWPWASGHAFRASASERIFPSLGVCFGEKVLSQTSRYGIFWKSEDVPATCRTIDESLHVLLAECQ